MMRRVLMVGCGGSGAKTLAYMMDQLKADLAEYGIDEIPGCWQFVNVDVPLREEDKDALGVPSVTKQGGRYVSCGVSGEGYPIVDAAITRKVSGELGGLRKLATWLPPTSQAIQTSLEEGAGQIRGLGRLLVLSKLNTVRTELARAVEAMRSPAASAQAWRLSEAVKSAGSPPGENSSPVVFVVSSMAGGSGSSMTLDICRLLSEIPGVQASMISAFMYTPEVFSNEGFSKSGMPGNALALLGETLSVQSSSGGETDRIDADLYTDFGIHAVAERSLQAVIPIGLKSSGGYVLGDGTAIGVYRSMGRGLARFLETPALDDYIQYLIQNPHPTPRMLWGLKAALNSEVIWGSFGFASLSMGRDLYAEYSAQRLARRAMDHAVSGHVLAEDGSGDVERLRSLWASRRGLELESLGLDAPTDSRAPGGATNAVGEWFVRQFGAQALGSRVRKVVTDTLSNMPAITEGISPLRWASQVSQHLRNMSAQADKELEDIAQDEVHQWAARLASCTEETVRRDVADVSIPYALSVLRQVSGPSGAAAVIQSELAALGQRMKRESLGVPQVVGKRISALGEKSVFSRGAMEDQTRRLSDDLVNQLASNWLVPRMAVLASTVLGDYVQGVAQPLEKALEKAVGSINEARDVQPRAQGLAQVTTETYQSWPAEPYPGQAPPDAVPHRFRTAHNEVALMGVDEFARCFDIHVVEAVRSELETGGQDSSRLDASLTQATRDVLLGEWASDGGDPPPCDLLIRTRDWVPRGLVLTVATATPVPAIYVLRVQTSDLLSRAREFVQRRGESFQVYCSQSLREYLTEADDSDVTSEHRAHQVAEAMWSTIALASPLIEMSGQVHRQVYGDSSSDPTVSYRFSEIPFLDLKAGRLLLDKLESSVNLDRISTDKSLQKASGVDPVTRVDVFGSYPLTVPIAYPGLLKYVDEEWSMVRGSPVARKAFWFLRRARPLIGVLPMSDAERRTMIRGWFVALLCGGVVLPGDRSAPDWQPVRIWDREDKEFLSFPAPMLTAPSLMKSGNEWLPAVLESKLLAFLEIGSSGSRSVDEALRPWVVLRSYGDDGTDPSFPDSQIRSDWKILELLVQKGTIATELTPVLDLAPMPDARARIKALREMTARIIVAIDETYLPGKDKPDGDGFWTNYRSRDLVAATPLTIDLASEMVGQLRVISEILRKLDESFVKHPPVPDF